MQPRRLAIWLRIVFLVAGLIPLVLLGVASQLQPNERGLGTHQQLGLNQCSLRQWAGIRCPSCGMTTSWSHMMHRSVFRSFQVNSGGALLALASLVACPWLIACGLTGRWIGGEPNEWWFAGVSVGIMVITLIDWGVRLYLERGQ